MRCACKCDAIRQAQALRRSCRRSPETENEALPNRRAHVGKVIDAGANDYITKLENAHGTEFGELLYPWHPWTGLRIGLHESVSKPDGIVFRCRLYGRRLEIPAWMFDRSACARVRVAADAHVDIGESEKLGAATARCSSSKVCWRKRLEDGSGRRRLELGVANAPLLQRLGVAARLGSRCRLGYGGADHREPDADLPAPTLGLRRARLRGI